VKLYRPATVLVGVLFVLLGGLTRLAVPDQVYNDEDNLIIEHGTVGSKLEFGDSTIEVTRMKLAKSYLPSGASDDDKPIETNGVYVALEWDTVRGTQNPATLNVTLEADGGTVYTPVGETTGNGIDFAAAGFGQTGAVVFEVNPVDLKGLTLKLRPSQFYNVLAHAIDVDLGVPSETVAQQLVDGAAEQYVIPNSVERVAQ
jgi:hypothetical protein